MGILFEKSFASHSKSIFWSELNVLTPIQVYKTSHKKFLFNCDKCNHEFIARVDNISNGNWCSYCSNKILCKNDNCKECFEKSFASHPKSTRWSKLNKLTPIQVFKSSQKKFWFNCDKCTHNFEARLSDINNKNRWCPYCSHQKLCNQDCDDCFEKSFASHLKSKFWSYKNKLKPRQVFKSSGKKFLFDCNNCKHTFEARISDINKGIWCPYCSSKILCENKNCNNCFEKSFASHSKSEFWSNKNELTPRQIFKGSNNKYIFNCNKCNNEFECILYNIINNRWCPLCKNKTELKLFQWLKNNKFNVQSQVNFDWCKKVKHLPFDFVIEDLKLIIELDGRQHFEQVNNWDSPDKTQINDNFKYKLALENGYKMIRICQRIVLNDKEDWQIQLINAINQGGLLVKIGNVYSL
jgi:very-short-patch-repair endonuclease/DNA-directed RNA polymerase subunit RPC12/RpoP